MSIQKKNRRLTITIALGVLGMFGFCYLLVPLYTMVCKKEGINGRASFQDSGAAHLVDRSRYIRVQLTTTLHGNLPFKFLPLTTQLTVHPGETKEIYFYAENDSGTSFTVQAVPSIAPGIAAKYLKKTQCFCFTQQTFLNHEKADMPVIFHIDPEIPNNITYLTLNYTLFDARPFLRKEKQLI